jgi:chemotaxis protein MotA
MANAQKKALIMDLLTLSGFLLSIIAVAGGQYLEGGDLHTLLNLRALIIVLGGTLGAVMVQSSFHNFIHAFRILPWVIYPPVHDDNKIIKQLLLWSTTTRSKGLLALDDFIPKERNHFLKKGLETLVTGCDTETLRRTLDIEIDTQESNDLQAAHVFDSMGGYSPTIGIIGAVLGLIEVMRHLTDPSDIGLGIAVSFIATIYGIAMANLFFIPVANKLKTLIRKRSQFYEMIIEGLIAIAEGEHPQIIGSRLRGFTHMTAKTVGRHL